MTFPPGSNLVPRGKESGNDGTPNTQELSDHRRTLVIVSVILGSATLFLVAALAVVLLQRRRHARHRSRELRGSKGVTKTTNSDWEPPFIGGIRFHDLYQLMQEGQEEPRNISHRRRRSQIFRWITWPNRKHGIPRCHPRIPVCDEEEGEEERREREMQRSAIIRKSLQSRTSVNSAEITAPTAVSPEPLSPPLFGCPTPPVPPLPPLSPLPVRTRSRTWHGNGSNDNYSASAAVRMGEKGGGRAVGTVDPVQRHHSKREKRQESSRDGDRRRADILGAQARVDYVFQLLNNRRRNMTSPPVGGGPGRWKDESVDGDEGESGGHGYMYESNSPSRPPTIRLKTPPLLSRPAFRNWGGAGGGVGGSSWEIGRGGSPKHTSLPTELTRARPTPLRGDWDHDDDDYGYYDRVHGA